MTHISEWQLFTEQLFDTIDTGLGELKKVSNIVTAFGSKGEIRITKTTRDNAQYQLSDLMGRMISQGKLNANETISVKQGVYMLRVVAGNQIQTVKVMVK